jgi:hypothetical protein
MEVVYDMLLPVFLLLIGIFAIFPIFSAAQLVAPATAKAVSTNNFVSENLEMFPCLFALVVSMFLLIVYFSA